MQLTVVIVIIIIITDRVINELTGQCSLLTTADLGVLDSRTYHQRKAKTRKGSERATERCR